jgi:hypothetical protein
MESRTVRVTDPPAKLKGEPFGAYWQRLTEEQAVGLAVAAKRMNIIPMALFVGHVPEVSRAR